MRSPPLSSSDTDQRGGTVIAAPRSRRRAGAALKARSLFRAPQAGTSFQKSVSKIASKPARVVRSLDAPELERVAVFSSMLARPIEGCCARREV
jgi:hypothetical protein